MVKIIIDRSDLSLIKDDLDNDRIQTSTLDDGSIELHVDDASYELLESILKKLTIGRQTYVFETPDGWIKLYIKDILYIESYGTEIIIHTHSFGKVLVKEPLYQLENALKDYQIMRIGKSYMVNLNKVIYIRPKLNAKLELELSGGFKVDVSRSYVKAFKQALGIGGSIV